jgi:5-methylcytosine-specific restriction endonuclease McrA
VADKENEQEWLDLAKKHSRRDLEELAKRAKEEAKKEAADKAAGQPILMPLPKTTPKAILPVYVNFKMSPTQYARYEAIWERVRKQQHVSADKVEALLEIMESFAMRDSNEGAKQANHLDHLDRTDCTDHPLEMKDSTPQKEGNSSRRRELPGSNKPPVQIHIHQCPDCAKATVQTCKGELEISKTDLEQALCDCQISKPNERNSSSIPPAIRRLVFAEARHQCQQPGCNHTSFLEVHHVIPRARGGTNDVSNLKLICSACHKLLHEKEYFGMGLLVKELPAIYQWQSRSFG